MTTREELIALAEHNGIYYRATPLGTSEMFCYDSSLEAFYHAAQRQAYERAASVCEKEAVDPHNVPAAIVARRCSDAIYALIEGDGK